MKRLLFISLTLVLIAAAGTGAFASTPSTLSNSMVYFNGAPYDDYQPSGTVAIPGMLNGFDTNGIGTLTFTTTQSGQLDIVLDYDWVASDGSCCDFSKQNGAAVVPGTPPSPPSGVTWQIDDFNLPPVPGDAWSLAAAGTALGNNNNLPDSTYNYDVYGGFGFDLSGLSGQQAVVTITASEKKFILPSRCRLVRRPRRFQSPCRCCFWALAFRLWQFCTASGRGNFYACLRFAPTQSVGAPINT
jgi:hypothetical protein